MELKINRNLILSFAGVLTVCAFILGGMIERITIVADEHVGLFDRPEGGQIIATLSPGQMAPVLGCKDIKHYIVPLVSLDGKTGFAVGGEYHLKRGKVWTSSPAPMSLSCP